MVSFFFKRFLFTFRERKGGRKRGKHQCVIASGMPPVGTWSATQACTLDWELNKQPFDLQAGTQSTEPHQPGLSEIFITASFVLFVFHINFLKKKK